MGLTMATLIKNYTEPDQFWHENSDNLALNATRESVIETWLREYERLESMSKDKLIRMIIGDRPC